MARAGKEPHSVSRPGDIPKAESQAGSVGRNVCHVSRNVPQTSHQRPTNVPPTSTAAQFTHPAAAARTHTQPPSSTPVPLTL